MRLEYRISPRKVFLILGVIALYFAVQSLIAEYLIENVLDENANRSVIMAIDLFSVNTEQTIPTWYSMILLWIASVLLAAIAMVKSVSQAKDRLYWVGLAVIFLYLSIDEGAVIHEIAADWLQTNTNLSGFLTFGWQIVAAPLVILFGLLYLRFLIRLPVHTRNLFILAGLVYVGGAMIIEGISANQWDIGGGVSYTYLVIATIEEFCEMIGVVIFIYALLRYMVEMRYTYVFASPQAVQASAEDHNRAGRFLRTSLRPVLLIAIAIVLLNIGMIYWAFTQAPKTDHASILAEDADADIDTPAPSASLLDELAAEGVVVTQVNNRFGIDNGSALQVSAALLDTFDEVMVVTLMSTQSSMILAADELPFDRDQLTEILHTHGEVQFIVYDTNAVEALTSAAQAS
jgi:hypothetical protein